MSVPFIDLRRFESDFLERWNSICHEISAATQFVGGPQALRLEEALARDGGVAAAVGCANGTDALQLALRAAGVREGDRVLLPDATFWATFEAIINVNAQPVTVDIDDVDLQMDFELFCRAADEFRPRAVILVHLYGWGSSRIDDFRAFCRARQIALIEDGAQVWGVERQGRPIFAGGELVTLSFYPAKVLGACGDAGAVMCGRAELAEIVRRLGNHGRTDHYAHGLVGWNSRLGGFDAAYLNLALEYLPQRLASRRRAMAIYAERLPDLGLEVKMPPEGFLGNGYLNVTLVEPERRPAIEAGLREAGIGFGNIYPTAISRQPGAEGYLVGAVGGEKADRLSRSVLNLPLFAYIEDEEIEETLAAVERSLD